MTPSQKEVLDDLTIREVLNYLSTRTNILVVGWDCPSNTPDGASAFFIHGSLLHSIALSSLLHSHASSLAMGAFRFDPP